MNHDDTLVLRPEVSAFVDEVRRRLADLDEETRDDLLGGLEADLGDQLADGTPLGDPATYATELRAAAGLPDARPRRLDLSGWRTSPDDVLDRARERFFDLVARPRLQPGWDLVTALRPAWWVARAWVAVTVVDIFAGTYEELTVVPTLAVPFLGELLLIAAIVVSTLIGLGRLWPGSGADRSTTRRLVLLAANLVAIVAPLTWSVPWPAHLSGEYDNWSSYDAGFHDGSRQQSGLSNDGRAIREIYAYDAAGKPIEQVQLVDQDGRPITIRPRDTVRLIGEVREVGCPARNGGVAVTNAFPFARLVLPNGLCTAARAATSERPTPPLASLPPITPAWPATPEEPAPAPQKR